MSTLSSCHAGNACCVTHCSVCVWGTAQDDLAPPVSPLFSPVVPYDVYVPNPSTPHTAFNSHLGEVKETAGDFSSVDLSFLPDELTHENKEQTVVKSRRETEENCKAQGQPNRLPLSSEEDTGMGLADSSLSNSHSHLHPDGADSAPPLPEKPNLDASPLASIALVTAMSPVSESSGIVSQLQ